MTYPSKPIHEQPDDVSAEQAAANYRALRFLTNQGYAPTQETIDKVERQMDRSSPPMVPPRVRGNVKRRGRPQ